MTNSYFNNDGRSLDQDSGDGATKSQNPARPAGREGERLYLGVTLGCGGIHFSLVWSASAASAGTPLESFASALGRHYIGTVPFGQEALNFAEDLPYGQQLYLAVGVGGYNATAALIKADNANGAIVNAAAHFSDALHTDVCAVLVPDSVVEVGTQSFLSGKSKSIFLLNNLT